MATTLSPYLNFNGKTAEAMKFYHSILGGDLNMQTFAEAQMAQTPAEKDLIMHAVLKSENFSIMASDTQSSRPATFGDNVHMSISGDDSSRLNGIFDSLSKGGRVDMPLAKQFWGDTFGMLTDRFGVHWMINISAGRPM